MTPKTPPRPTSSHLVPNPGDDLRNRPRPVVPYPGGDEVELASNGTTSKTSTSSQQNGTTWNPGSVWLITTRTRPAWEALADILEDDQWHPKTTIINVMTATAGLAPQTIKNHLRSASARGWIRQRHGKIRIRHGERLEAELSAML